MARPKVFLTALATCASILAVVAPATSAGASASITEFSMHVPATPLAIVAGPDGRLWFTSSASAIGRITTSGSTKSYPLGNSPEGIAVGPDGRLWVTDSADGNLERVKTNGSATPIPLTHCCTEGIALGSDGKMWFEHNPDGGGFLGRATKAGVVREKLLLGTSHSAFSITPGPDGNLWVADSNATAIKRITTAFKVTGTFSTSAKPSAITVGPDGNLWFTEGTANQIGRVTPAGDVTEFPIPTADSFPVAITSGPDGALWFTEGIGNQIGRITTDGTVTDEIPVPTGSSFPSGITAGPDGNIWFAETAGGKIGRVNLA
jgi:virginiamycin B lyase